MIAYLLLRLAVLLFGYLPFFFLYFLSDIISRFFYCLGIRRRTIVKNLQDAFPEKNKSEIQKLTKSVYRYFFDVMFVESLKGFTASTEALLARFHFDISLGEYFFKQNKSIIVVMPHYANWEWAVTFPILHEGIAFYKPIKNPYIDRYVKKNRSRHHFELVSALKPMQVFLKYRHQPTAYALIADKQNIKKRDERRTIWVSFLGKQAPFLLGPERYAQALNYPVIYFSIQRSGRRGRYHARAVLVSEHPNEEAKGAITQRWATLLERQIQSDPAAWLWFWASTRSRQEMDFNKKR